MQLHLDVIQALFGSGSATLFTSSSFDKSRIGVEKKSSEPAEPPLKHPVFEGNQ